MSNTIQFGARVDADVYRRLKLKSAELGEPIHKLVERALIILLDQICNPPTPPPAVGAPRRQAAEAPPSFDLTEPPQNLKPLDQALAAYNTMATDIGLPVTRSFTRRRQQLLAARLRDLGGLEGWHTALDNVRQSDFIRSGRWSGFCLDSLLSPTTIEKLMDGAYGGKPRAGGGRPSGAGMEKLAAMDFGDLDPWGHLTNNGRNSHNGG